MLGAVIADVTEKRSLSASDKSRLLKDALRQLPQLRSLLITDSAGLVLASTNDQLIGFDGSQREYFITTIRRTSRFISRHLSRP
jgi:hypothetical protein